MWRSLVARLLWEQDVAGSNPVIPTFLLKTMVKSLLEELHSNPLLKKRWVGGVNDSLLNFSVNSSKTAEWLCLVCDQVTVSSIRNKVLKPDSCSVCQGKIVIPGVNDLQVFYPELVAEWFEGNSKRYTEVSKSSGFSATWVCSVCSHRWVTKVSERTRVSKATGCPSCAVKQRQQVHLDSDCLPYGVNVPVVLKELFSAKNNKRVSYRSRERLLWECGEGHEWECSPQTVLKHHGCPVCSVTLSGLKFTHPWLESEWADDSVFGLFTAGSAYKASWVCDKGHEWKAHVYSRTLSSSGCPVCANSQSSGEREVKQYLETMFGLMVETKNKSLISPFELDMYVPEKKVAVEFNGSYWHSSQFKTPDYHYNKWLKCKKLGITLVQVWEHEWVENRSVVENWFHLLFTDPPPKGLLGSLNPSVTVGNNFIVVNNDSGLTKLFENEKYQEVIVIPPVLMVNREKKYAQSGFTVYNNNHDESNS